MQDIKIITEKFSDDISQFDMFGPNFAQCPECGAILDIGTEEDWPTEWLDGAGGDIEWFNCPECGMPLPASPSPYDIGDYLADDSIHDELPTIEYIVDGDGDYIGAIVNHTNPQPWEDKPHIWTDTRYRRTYGFQNGELVKFVTVLHSLDNWLSEHAPQFQRKEI